MTPSKKEKYINLLEELCTNASLHRTLKDDDYCLFKDLIYDLCGEALIKYEDLDKLFEVRLVKQRSFESCADNKYNNYEEDYEIRFKNVITLRYSANKDKKSFLEENKDECKRVILMSLLEELKKVDKD